MTFAPISQAANELKGLADVLEAAADHHDPATPTRHDLAVLANRASAVSPPGLFEVLLKDPTVIAALLALIERLTAPKAAPAPQPPTAQPPAPPPVAPSPTPALPVLLYPTDLRIDLDISDNNGEPIPFTVTEKADHYAVELHGSTTNVPLHSCATLRAGYCLNGQPFRFEDQTPPALHLYHTARWIAREVGGQGRVSMLAPLLDSSSEGPAYVQVNGPGGRIVNWNNKAEQPQEATRTGGMDVPMKFPAEANDAVIEVTLEVDTPNGTVRHDKPVRFPKAS